MPAKIVMVVGVVLFALVVVILFRGRRANRDRVLTVEEIRQHLMRAKPFFPGGPDEFERTADRAIASLRAQYGDRVPLAAAYQVISQTAKLPDAGAPGAASAAPVTAPAHLSTAPAAAPAPLSAVPAAAPGSFSAAPVTAAASLSAAPVTAAASLSAAPAATAASLSAAPVTAAAPPDGISVENTPVGFVLAASCRSFAGAATWLIFAAVIAILPFRLWGDLIRDFWTSEGLSFWLTGLLFAAWACGFLYVTGNAAFNIWGQIRVTQSGDDGQIFAGIGGIGFTHHVHWSDFSSVEDREAATYMSSARFRRATHYIVLSGPSKSYKFGDDLSPSQRAFVVDLLRKRAPLLGR